MSKGRIAFGAVVGAVAGFAAGLLTAPKSGKETRADIAAKAHELKDEATTAADAVKDDVIDTAQEVKDKAGEFKTRVDQAVDGARHGFNKKP